MRKAIGKILKVGTLVSTWGLIAMVLLQIICRFSWFETPSWTEEASRILFIYAISFASGLALKSSNYYVALDAFYNRFSPKLKTFLDKSIPIVIFLLFAVFAFYSIQFVSLGMIEKSPSMGFNMGVSFFSMFIIGSTLCYYAWHKIVKAFKRKST
ncbi:TRAP transporter small permease subunit [Maribacter algarum]|uniref:TRAP transporter small permease subunit n=1 Tax=Maribacter algarum (ex Zhang et al. 2020) TaxID=2578118 RepID=A0A5S3PUE9_9FLAO|nr:TRAP transporter small permease subunit [Maribacter algarum]TMM58570.1 TRAP transporter small permease subunit [Maribacter algarum]